ncbi:TIGR04282 family arsenosugar biosynthesis glycosyltransferase [Azospirillum rugosum]|uniref:RSAM/selenodomain-associated transferase 1 n=1 Tax=Azospirillum rugosum TaxID=416170 RepID=A0ABS4SW21_9PROT|nr:TIGR04282 family arsenosugar biosynthesis glycosyltransferase [Azospirillum rugosum]MBP2296750.1 rSAM/selenodomain-associated transferase 1 [Azospirillum rugosum]MDQ0530437.1 rSAM/selenodomain-associated transferase 1 [Azospirillum rugosum]
MRRRNHLIVFARPPRFGRGKRRLAKGIGAFAAWRFYRTALSALLRRLSRDPRWTLWLAVTPDRSAGERGWPVRTRRVGQGKGDLGQRMARALGERPCGSVVLIGSDIPGIQPADIAAAFRSLGRNDFVFGPARDGGYWLVGARRTAALPRTLFAGVRWSTPHALADTVAGLPPGTKVGLVATMEDVDDHESYRRVWLDGGHGRARRKR